VSKKIATPLVIWTAEFDELQIFKRAGYLPGKRKKKEKRAIRLSRLNCCKNCCKKENSIE
jgi:hypothetical protein